MNEAVVGDGKRVVVYSTSWCPYCDRVRALLARKQVDYRELDIEAQPERRAEMIARSGRRTVPQVFIGDRHVGGCDDMHALEASGELDRLLAN